MTTKTTRMTGMKFAGRFGSLGLESGMNAMTIAAGNDIRTRMAAKISMEILAHCRVLIRPTPVAMPQALNPKKKRASKITMGPALAGASGIRVEFNATMDASTIIAPQRMVKVLPINTTTAETVIPDERDMRNAPRSLPAYISHPND